MLSVTLLPSGTGVKESLALDHAPFTRRTSVGTFVGGLRVLEKSPPLAGGLTGRELWLEADSDRHNAMTQLETARCIRSSNPSARRRRELVDPSPRLWRKRPGGTFSCLARRPVRNDYSERKKFSKSCCWLVLRLSKFSSTVVASLPLL